MLQPNGGLSQGLHPMGDFFGGSPSGSQPPHDMFDPLSEGSRYGGGVVVVVVVVWRWWCGGLVVDSLCTFLFLFCVDIIFHFFIFLFCSQPQNVGAQSWQWRWWSKTYHSSRQSKQFLQCQKKFVDKKTERQNTGHRQWKRTVEASQWRWSFQKRQSGLASRQNAGGTSHGWIWNDQVSVWRWTLRRFDIVTIWHCDDLTLWRFDIATIDIAPVV